MSETRPAGGLELHLDPRRTMDGYSGTGYRGVFEDYWPSGYKRERPFTVMYDGSYVGRYATVLRAAVQFARGSRRGCLSSTWLACDGTPYQGGELRAPPTLLAGIGQVVLALTHTLSEAHT